jgi:DNA-binding IclR family transcriptional regulator
MAKPAADGAQAIRRAITLLRLIARRGRGGAHLSELAQLADLSPSTARRILKCLLEARMAAQGAQGRKYRIGPLVGELAMVSPSQDRVVERWHPVVARIAESVRATTYLVMRSDLDVVVVDGVDGGGYIRAVPFTIGQRYPLGVGAGSIALLATEDVEQVDEILAANATQYRRYDEGTAERVRELVARARDDEYAFSAHARRMPGVCGLGVAVPGGEGAAVLSISIATVAEMLAPPVRARLARQIRREIQSVLRD